MQLCKPQTHHQYRSNYFSVIIEINSQKLLMLVHARIQLTIKVTSEVAMLHGENSDFS